MLRPKFLTPQMFGAMILPYAGSVLGYDSARGHYIVRFPSLWTAAQFHRDWSCELAKVSLQRSVNSFSGDVEVRVVIDPYWLVDSSGDDVGTHDFPMPE